MRNNRNVGSLGVLSPGFPMNRPGTGGMMPGMRKMPGMPTFDDDSREVPKSKSLSRGDVNRVQNASVAKSTSNSRLLPQGSGGLIPSKTSAFLQGSGLPARSSLVSGGTVGTSQKLKSVGQLPLPIVQDKPVTVPRLHSDELEKKTVALLEEYFHIRILDEALQCVNELNSPEYHPEVVKEAINLALDKGAPCLEPLVKFLEYLLARKVFTPRDLGTGCILYGAMIDDIAIDLPKAPTYFGEVVGKLIQLGGVDFSVLEEILKKIEDADFRLIIFNAAIKIIKVDAQTVEIGACQNLFG